MKPPVTCDGVPLEEGTTGGLAPKVQLKNVEKYRGPNKTGRDAPAIPNPEGSPLTGKTNSEAYFPIGAASNHEMCAPTTEPDPASAATHADVRRLVAFLQQQLDREVEDHSNDVRHTVQTAVEAALNILSKNFSNVADSTLPRALENGRMLALITEAMERAARSYLYLRNLATALSQTNEV